MATSTKTKTTLKPKSVPTSSGKISQGLAIAALILNILVLPGLGTIIGGRTKTGITQLVITLVSLPLCLILIGFPILFGMWVWALVTGIEMVKESE